MEILDRASLRIVHIDDDPDFVRLAGIFLERAGFSHSIAHYTDGRSAIADLQRDGGLSCPHAVLLDLHMPRMDGHEVLRLIREKHSKHDLAVFMLTSSVEEEDIWKAAANGANSYLVKTHTLMAVIERFDYLIEEINAGEGPMYRKRAEPFDFEITHRRFLERERHYA